MASRRIGEGQFATVYLGYINDMEVRIADVVLQL
jgi:hypothetical protein